MNTNIIAELKTTREDFLKALTAFDQDNFNTVPFSGSWTAGQVAEHIFKSIDGVAALLTGDATPTERDPNQNTQGIRDLFLNFEIKMNSPDFILPSDKPKDQTDMSQKIGNALQAIIDAGEQVDADLTIVGFEFPGSGPLTRIELLNFISVHTQRHAHQLRGIRERL